MFGPGDSLEIRKVDQILDQPGRTRGSLITGAPPVRPSSWNDQVTEPCYSWNNGGAGFAREETVREGEHYFNDTPMPGYTPYVYPHPLVTGERLPAPPATPSSSPHRQKKERGGLKRRGWTEGRKHSEE
jgi:hypothetical protein